MAHSGLCQVEQVRGGGDAPALGHGQKIEIIEKRHRETSLHGGSTASCTISGTGTLCKRGGAAADASKSQTQARLAGDHYVINDSKIFSSRTAPKRVCSLSSP